MAKGSRDNPLKGLILNFSNHGVSFAAASLPIGENSAIVAGQYVFHQVVGSFGIDSLLVRVFTKYIIKGEGFYIVDLIGLKYRNLVVFFICPDYAGAASVFLLLVHWPDADNHLDCLTHRSYGIEI